MPTITPVAAVPASTDNNSQKPISARERAIAKLTSAPAPTNAQESPVQNPTAVSPEELSAISPPSEGQNDSSGDPASSEAAAPEAEASKPSTTEAKEPLSAQYAQLARKEKAIRAKMQEIKTQEANVKAQLEQFKAQEARIAKLEALEKRLGEDPLNVLLERGVSYDQITQQALNQPSESERAAKSAYEQLQNQIKQIQEAQENSKKLFEDQQRQQYDQAVNQIRNQAKSLVESNPEFETIKETGSLEDVVDLIKQTFEADGVLMTVEEAAAEVENHLVEEAIKIARLNKIQQRLKPAPAKVEAPKQQDATPKQQPKTLTNAATATRPLSAKERAILAFKGQLNNK